MSGETKLTALLKGMTPVLNEGAYIFTTVKKGTTIDIQDCICTFQEKEGVTMVLAKEKADQLKVSYEFVAAWITLTVHSALDAIGLTAVFSTALAEHNISCNVIAGFYHDHIFVAQKDAQNAMKILTEISKANS